MDISAIVVTLVLATLFFGAIVWLEIHSRKTHRANTTEDRGISDESKKEISGLVRPPLSNVLEYARAATTKHEQRKS